MPVLTRRDGDEVVIGDTIRVTVLETHGNKVRLGITTPDNVGVLCGEVADRLAARGPDPHDPRRGRRLQWPVYDHALLEQIAKDLGVRTNLVESVDERRKS